MNYGSGFGSCFFRHRWQDANKKSFFFVQSFFAYYFWRYIYCSFIENSRKSRFFLIFLLVEKGSGSVQHNVGGPKTYPDSDPQQCYLHVHVGTVYVREFCWRFSLLNNNKNIPPLFYSLLLVVSASRSSWWPSPLSSCLQYPVKNIWNDVFYVPEAYLTHFSYRCWFLNCSVLCNGRYGWGDEVNLLCHAKHPPPSPTGTKWIHIVPLGETEDHWKGRPRVLH